MIVLCECGCGRPAPIATQTSKRWKRVRGFPMRFIAGHGPRPPVRQRAMRPYVDAKRRVRFYLPEHPNATRGGYVREHVIVAARAPGKALPVGVVVHHVDEDPSNNNPTNLVICQDSAYHSLLHKRLRAYRATGCVDAVKCLYCKEWILPGDPRLRVRPRCGSHHLECRRLALHAQKERRTKEEAS